MKIVTICHFAIQNISSCISGVYWVPAEAYLSWCQQTFVINFSHAFMIFLIISTIVITVICQAYIQVQLGMNSINCITIKHIFYLFPLFLGLSIILVFFLTYAAQLASNEFIALKVHIVVAAIMLSVSTIPIGFVVKNHENTFPILKSLLSEAIFSNVHLWIVETFIQDDRVYEINL